MARPSRCWTTAPRHNRRSCWNYSTAHARRALAIRSSLYGPESPEAVTGLVNLGNAHAMLHDYASAETFFLNAVNTARRICTERCEALATAYSGMHAFHYAQGNEEEARKYDELVLAATPWTSKRGRKN
jgi:tetratricopeptide (TPR) repeat protein